MSKVVLGILTGILIFVAAGILATYWVGKMRREMEQKRPQVATAVEGGVDSGLAAALSCGRTCEKFAGL